MALQFESGVLTQVFFKIGERPDGTPKLLRAPIDVLQWGAVPTTSVDTYVVTVGAERVTDEDLNDSLANDGREAVDLGQEFGFYRAFSHVVDLNGASDKTLWGVQFFGPV